MEGADYMLEVGNVFVGRNPTEYNRAPLASVPLIPDAESMFRNFHHDLGRGGPNIFAAVKNRFYQVKVVVKTRDEYPAHAGSVELSALNYKFEKNQNGP